MHYDPLECAVPHCIEFGVRANLSAPLLQARLMYTCIILSAPFSKRSAKHHWRKYLSPWHSRIAYLHSKAHFSNSLLKSLGISRVFGSRSARIFFTNSLVTSLICATCALTVRGCIMCGLTFDRKSCHNLPWLKAGERPFQRETRCYIVRNLRRPLCLTSLTLRTLAGLSTVQDTGETSEIEIDR